MSFNTSVLGSERLFPKNRPSSGRITALSLLDAVTVDYETVCATWLFKCPTEHDFSRSHHLRHSLRLTLDAYPQFCGRLKLITATNSTTTLLPDGDEFPPHARRLGRVHAIYGTSQDPGVEFILAESTTTANELYPDSRTGVQPLWDRTNVSVSGFLPTTPVKKVHVTADTDGPFRPAVAVQMTSLTCGGFVLAVKIAHPLVDAHSLTHFVKDWASVSRALSQRAPIPVLTPLFDPGLLDSHAAGDINSNEPDQTLIQQAESLHLHRYDWWIESPGCPWPYEIPEPFRGQDWPPAGLPMPWSEYDSKAPVSHYLIHLNHDQIEHLWREASRGSTERLSRHDAVLAHVWSCVNRARLLQDDPGPVHCDLSYGLRTPLMLGDAFMGSPTFMVNVEMTGKEVTAETPAGQPATAAALGLVAQRFRQTICQSGNPDLLAAYLHTVAFETCPQRIWQGFLGRRHTMVTSWVRAGVYDVDFGWGPARYVDAILANLDGLVLIKEAPPPTGDRMIPEPGTTTLASWTAHGVDINLHLKTEDMERLIRDPLLLREI
ncbi:hypothetical protein FE257_002355 [Aspergillus nanangensis]|uniref:Transferase family protein n=1 Tax=Aspergillus nanangensis TaxID=2582783 RepID=A0AAD4GP46_ASPNN|nr:hypothetical protein FE257_002355 [Aspergillus nanangensis]